jgi:HAD superfamily hydrolase (TIGR01549 family)
MTTWGVLFDIGGPIDMETARESLIDAHIRAAVEQQGLVVTDEQYTVANDRAVASFARDAYAAIIWQLTDRNPSVARAVYQAFRSRDAERQFFELRPGIAELLAELHHRGLHLGLAANQPYTTLAKLDDLGVGQYFHHREVSGVHGFHKPDTRLFLRACQDLSVEPSQCIMVGDRIDNDIVPGVVLGMQTIRFRAGRHAQQQPRDWTEIPDVEVGSVSELRKALAVLTVA